MSPLHTVQVALEEKSGTTSAAHRLSTAEEKKQEQGEAAGYFQRTGPSGGPGVRRELFRRELLDMLGQSSTLTGRGNLMALEEVMFQSALVLRMTKITLMMIPWVSPISWF